MLSELNKQWLQKPKEKGERRQAKLREYFNSLPIFKKNYERSNITSHSGIKKKKQQSI